MTGELRVAGEAAEAAGKLRKAKPEEEASLVASFHPSLNADADYAERSRAHVALQAIQADKRQRLATDRMGYAASVGVAELEAFDPTDPESVRARWEAYEMVSEYFKLPPGSMITAEEGDMLRDAWRDSDAKGRVAMLKGLRSGMDDNAYAAFMGGLFESRQQFMAVVGGLAAADPGVAFDIVKGDELRRGDGKLAPPEADARPTIDKYLGDALRLRDDLFSPLNDAVGAYYAKMAADAGDHSGTINPGRLDQALETVTGGVVEWNGHQLLPPVRGMDSDAFEDLMDGLSDQTMEDFGNGVPTALTGGRVTVEHLRRYGLVATVGAGRYALFIRSQAVLSENGNPFIIDLKALAGKSGGW